MLIRLLGLLVRPVRIKHAGVVRVAREVCQERHGVHLDFAHDSKSAIEMMEKLLKDEKK